MRHQKSGVKLNRTSSHRKAMFRNMVTSLFKYESIRTTETKAKELRRWADHLITLAKRGDLHARRQALSIIREKDVVHKLFEEAPARYAKVTGGYTRLVKIGRRAGDAAPLSIVELIAPDPAKKKKKAPKKAAKTAPAPKPEEKETKAAEEQASEAAEEKPAATEKKTKAKKAAPKKKEETAKKAAPKKKADKDKSEAKKKAAPKKKAAAKDAEPAEKKKTVKKKTETKKAAAAEKPAKPKKAAEAEDSKPAAGEEGKEK